MTAAPAQVLVGIAGVIAACLGTTAAVAVARRSGNWLYYLVALGLGAFVAGVVGQRVFPSEDTVRQLGHAAASGGSIGPWDAGIRVPLLDVHLTPVAVGGLLLALAGVSLVLLFEAMPQPRAPAPPMPPLEEEDGL